MSSKTINNDSYFLGKAEAVQWILDNKKIKDNKGLPEKNIKIAKKRATDAFDNMFEACLKNKDKRNRVKRNNRGNKMVQLIVLEERRFDKPRPRKPKIIKADIKAEVITPKEWGKNILQALPEHIRHIYINTAHKKDTTVQNIFLKIILDKGRGTVNEIVKGAYFEDL